MFFRIFLSLCAVAAIYACYEIYATVRRETIIQTPPADFMVMNGDSGNVPVLQVMDLDFKGSKDAHILLADYAAENKNIRYLVRPLFRGEDKGKDSVRYLFAAGLQGKYWDMLRLISQYEGPITPEFFTENASIADLDLEKLKKDAKSAEIDRIMDKNDLAIRETGIKSTQALIVGGKVYYLGKPLTRGDLAEIIGNETPGR